jgi:hypothetical protein
LKNFRKEWKTITIKLILINQKKYLEALEHGIIILERAQLEKIEDDEIINKIKKHIVHINNYCTTKHLEKNEKTMAKYFIDTSNKFMFKDYNLYITLKNNISCYNLVSGHNFVAKGLIKDLLKVNTIKKVEEMCIQSSNCNI